MTRCPSFSRMRGPGNCPLYVVVEMMRSGRDMDRIVGASFGAHRFLRDRARDAWEIGRERSSPAHPEKITSVK
jgi:hypothetical protein